MAKTKAIQPQNESVGTLSKLFNKSEDTPLTKPEVMGVLLALKVAVAIIVGIACGSKPVIGGLGFIVYIVSSCVSTFLVYRSVLGVDEEEMGGHTALMGEDQNIGLPLFMLTWIVTFSSVWW